MVQKSKPPAAANEPERRGEPERGGEPKRRDQPKRRGRPRAYEPDVALGKALDLFRRQGFAATSLDDLSEATGMNRPSLYGAFGDKRELYIKSYQRYREEARASMAAIFREEMPVRQRLERIFASALSIYLSGETGPRGCFTVVTAASEAVGDPEIRAMVLDGLTEARQGLCELLPPCPREGRVAGERRSARAGPDRIGHRPHHRHPLPRACRARIWRRSSRVRSM